MQFLSHARKGNNTLGSLWMCRRCWLSSQPQQRPINHPTHPTHPTHPKTSAPGKVDKQKFKRNDVFFVPLAITAESKEIVKTLQGGLPIDKGIEVYNSVKRAGKLHWSLYSTYIPYLIAHKRYDDAFATMHEAALQSMIHPHLHNLYLRLLFSKGLHDMAFSYLKEVGYTPYEGIINQWMETLLEYPTPENFGKAKELAEFLHKYTTTPIATAYSVIYKKTLLTNYEPEQCLQILTIFKQANQEIPDYFSQPLLLRLLHQQSNDTHVRQLIDITTTDVLLQAVDWFNHRVSKKPFLQLYKLISTLYPNLQHDFFKTLGPETFAKVSAEFAEILTPKFDPETKELRLEESDSCLLSALATQPQFGELLLARMVAKSVTVDSIYFEYKLECNAPSEPEELFAWYCRAIRRYGVRPSQIVNNTVVFALLKVGKYERAREVFEWMKGEGLDIRGIHLNFARYYLHNKQPDKAFNVMTKDLIQDGLKLTMDDCNRLVDILGRGGYLKVATKMCQFMRAYKMHPTITTQFFMMKNTLKHEGLDDAFILLDRIYTWKLTPDRPIYDMLLKQTIADRRWEKLDELRVLMSRDRLFLNLRFYNMFVDGYLKAGNETEAEVMLQRISAVGYTPNEETYRILLQHHAAGKNTSKIKLLYNKIMDQPAHYGGLKGDLAKAFLAVNHLEWGFRMTRELVVLKLADMARDLLDVMCYTACYAKEFGLVQTYLLKLKASNLLPSPSVIEMVMDQMVQAQFDCSQLAVALNVAEPAKVTPATPLPRLRSQLVTPPITEPSPSEALTHTPPISPIPTPAKPFADLFPPVIPDATLLLTPAPTHSNPVSPATTPSISITTSSQSPISPPTPRPSTTSTIPRAPTSSTLSPSSARSSILSRDAPFEFRDTHAHLRNAHAQAYDTKKPGIIGRFYFAAEEARREEEEQKKVQEDPFKEFAYVYEESAEEKKARESEWDNRGETRKVEEKRNSRLREMFMALKLW